MKKKATTIIILTLALFFSLILNNSINNHYVFASGNLDINWGVNSGDPIFNLNDQKPGDIEQRTIEIKNNCNIPRTAFLKGEKTGPLDQTNPLLESILAITVQQGDVLVYGQGSLTGPKTVQDFFNDSLTGIRLTTVDPAGSAVYKIKVVFPFSAGNEFQKKILVFNLSFGFETGLVINEIYYKVDGNHGYDSSKDRGFNINISGNGGGSSNRIKVKILNTCYIVQNNTSNIFTDIINIINTGGNTASNNSGNTNIQTGNVNQVTNIFSFAGINIGSCQCNQCPSSQTDEWVEIYNRSCTDISLKNWTLTDNSGNATKINANKIIKAGGFALISENANTWNYWSEDPVAVIINLGKEIGDGLDNGGDRLYLKNPAGVVFDYTAWQNDSAIWNPAVPQLPLGSSMGRISKGYDFDSVSDWISQNPPSPGK